MVFHRNPDRIRTRRSLQNIVSAIFGKESQEKKKENKSRYRAGKMQKKKNVNTYSE